MKKNILTIGTVSAISVLVAGCGPRLMSATNDDAGTEISASELARLQDFHVWKLSIPESKQPFQSLRLVLVEPNGTVVPQFGTGHGKPPPDWTNILLGLRCEGGSFVGKLEVHGPKDTWAWKVSFTNASAATPRAWVVGRPIWDGNRAELATFWKGAANGGDGNNYNTLAVELVK